MFATERHAGQKRKKTEFDYICHPMEVLQYDDDTRDAYREATELFKDIFVKYYIDAKAGKISGQLNMR